MKKNLICLIILLLSLCVIFSGCSEPTEANKAPSVDSDALSMADSLYNEGKYEESLEEYLSVMETSIKNMDARLGVVRCQIALGNYEIARINLSMAQQIDPNRVEICELYLEMSELTGDIGYAQQAIYIASEYGYDSILSSVPAAPVFTNPEGAYSEKILLDITCSDPDAEIYVTMENSENGYYYLYNEKYKNPIPLLRGTNTVSAYSCKNGIPSATVSITYTISYDVYEVTFQEPLIEEIIRYQLGKPTGPITNYDCEQITQLDWYSLYDISGDYNWYMNQKLHSLEDLQHLPALNYLYLYYQTEVTDYSPLQYCPMLWQVGMYYCGLKDTKFVQNLSSVYYLYLYGNEISDFSALEQMDNLYGLYVSDNNGGNIEQVLRNNKNLESLSMDDDQLSDYSILEELDNLYYLGITGMTYVDYSALGNITSLGNLSIGCNYERGEYNSSIGDLSFLQNLPDLEYLTLYCVNDSSDLEYIKQLKKLTSLSLYNSKTTYDSAAMQSLMNALPGCTIYY